MIACALFAFDRPEYLAETLASLERQTFKDVYWFAFVDGNKLEDSFVGDEKGRLESIKLLLDSSIEFEEIFMSHKNRGMGKQKLFSHELYDIFDTIVFFEDDMVVSKHYIEVLLSLRDFYPEYEMVTSCDRYNDLEVEDFTEDKLEEVGEWNTHFWGYLLTKQAASHVTPVLRDYCDVVGENYYRRPGNLIRNTFGVGSTSHDGILDKYLKVNGVKRLTTKLPRAKYIGEYGMHCTPGIFRKFFDHPYEWYEEPFRYDY